MKRLCLLLAVLLLLSTLTACHSIPEPPAPVMEEPTIEPVVEEPEPEPIPEPEPEPVPVFDPAAIEAKTQQASICPCLAVEYAQWNLARHGFSDYTGEPLNSVLAAFSAYVTENWDHLAQTYGDLVNGTLWIIDHDEFGYYLQIIRFDETAQQLVMLQWDGASISVFEEGKPLDACLSAVCAKYCTEEAYTEATVQYEAEHAASPEEYYRICSLPTRDYCLSTFSAHLRQSEQIQAEITLLSGLTPEMEKILRVDYTKVKHLDGTELGEEAVLLQDFLLRFLLDEPSCAAWFVPAVVTMPPGTARYETLVAFYEIKNMMLQLLKDFEADAEFKDQIMELDIWSLTTDGDGHYNNAMTATENGIAVLTLTSSPAGTDSEDILTPSRKRVQKLAENGSRSELIPDYVKADVVDYVMDGCWNSGIISGNETDVRWRWSIQGDGVYMMKCEQTNKDSTIGDIFLQWDSGKLQEVYGN